MNEFTALQVIVLVLYLLCCIGLVLLYLKFSFQKLLSSQYSCGRNICTKLRNIFMKHITARKYSSGNCHLSSLSHYLQMLNTGV